MSSYIPAPYEHQKQMLSIIEVEDYNDLFQDIPNAVKLKKALDLPSPLSEMEIEKVLRQKANKNKSVNEYTCFLGGGAYDHYVPALVDDVISRSEFYTAYTPYQPEISQGTLQAIFEYQTMICELTGMDVCNASMYDGATALAEAAILACSTTRRDEVIVSKSVNPHHIQVLKTYARFRDINVIVCNIEEGSTDFDSLTQAMSDKTAAVIIQNPNFFGVIEDALSIAKKIHENKSLFIQSVDPLSLSVLKEPSETGADIVIGEGQVLGNHLSFGGPYLGFFAAGKKLMRKIPGRIVGQTTDKNGKTGYVLTLQAREQHIRREKATSNICTNQALNALAASIYMTVLGPDGLKNTAELCVQKSHYTYKRLIDTGLFSPVSKKPFFKEFLLKPVKAQSLDRLLKFLAAKNLLGGINISQYYPELGDALLIAVTEKRTKEEIDTLVESVVEYYDR